MSVYREIFDKFPDGVTLHDPDDGSVLYANRQFAEMLGYTVDELKQLDFDDFILDEPPYTAERAEQYVRKAATEGPQTFEWRDQTKAGEPLPVEVNLRFTDIEGQERVLAVVRDISDRKTRERELERKNERLEEFASIVSHDLKNPLRVIEGHVELAREESDSDHLEAIDGAAGRMRELIDDLLSLVRQPETPPDLEQLALDEVVRDCWQTVPTAEATLDLDAELTVRADPVRLRQLFENLLRNAIEHGGERVTIRIGELADRSGFFIEDDGPGIPADRKDRLFEAGFSTKADGTGYGLNIVRRAVDAHGWEIHATEGSDGGARFEVTNVDTTRH